MSLILVEYNLSHDGYGFPASDFRSRRFRQLNRCPYGLFRSMARRAVAA